jgi:hypothetical protein
MIDRDEHDWMKELERSRETSRLERWCGLSDREAETRLNDMQGRARWLALNIRCLGDVVDGGYVLNSKLLEKLLIARENDSLSEKSFQAFNTLLTVEAATNGELVVRREDVGADYLFVPTESVKELELASENTTPEQSGLDGFDAERVAAKISD